MAFAVCQDWYVGQSNSCSPNLQISFWKTKLLVLDEYYVETYQWLVDFKEIKTLLRSLVCLVY